MKKMSIRLFFSWVVSDPNLTKNQRHVDVELRNYKIVFRKQQSFRRQEAANAAELLGGQYHCLECEDVFAMYDKSTLLKVINLIRKARPTIIITHSPQDAEMKNNRNVKNNTLVQ